MSKNCDIPIEEAIKTGCFRGFGIDRFLNIGNDPILLSLAERESKKLFTKSEALIEPKCCFFRRKTKKPTKEFLEQLQKMLT